jgi:hypothetical protein
MADSGRHQGFAAFLFVALAGASAAARAAAPYPASPVITGIQWDSTGNIIRLAGGTDNWPCTWGDDDNIYTAGGDGNGFGGGSKQSLWVCRVSGDPPNISGENITALASGGGGSGKKASGMLVVEGVLYMWARNADGNGNKCQLAWSTDRGKNWSWAGWMWDEFGYCTFVNYGRDYAGARDGYVYTVSPDTPSAYDSKNKDMVLMRVPKAKIKQKADYEFFAGLDAGGDPLWTSNVSGRKPVFSHRDNTTNRTGISYDAPLGRYLWWQQNADNGIDTRSSGGFGVYDAPEPWGPWTTVYYTASWDVGPGETACFPTKWMSPDGKTVHLVFSGNDNFSVRKATLTASSAASATREDIDSEIRDRRAGSGTDSDVRALVRSYREQ